MLWTQYVFLRSSSNLERGKGKQSMEISAHQWLKNECTGHILRWKAQWQKEEAAHDGVPMENCDMGEKQVQAVVQQLISLKVQNPVTQAAAAIPEARREGQVGQGATVNPSTSGNLKLDRHHLSRRRPKVRRERRKYDRKGRLLCDGLDVCDCLQMERSGCFYPCPKHSSKKCGVKCHCNHKWVYNKVEDQSADVLSTLPVRSQ